MLQDDWTEAGQAIGLAQARLGRLRSRLNEVSAALADASELNRRGFIGNMSEEHVAGQHTLLRLSLALSSLEAESVSFQEDLTTMGPLLGALLLPEEEEESE